MLTLSGNCHSMYLCSSDDILPTLIQVHVPQKHDPPIGLPHLSARRPPPAPFASAASVSWVPLEQPAPALRSLGPGTRENPDSQEPGLAGTLNLQGPPGTLPFTHLGGQKR